MVGLDVDALLDAAKAFGGLYFETGQGSAVTNGAAEGVDMVTLESRAYGLARHIQREGGAPWMIVNDVAGFIGPEVFANAEQLERACLEDTVMAKLHGLTMGLDVCATFHMGIAPAALRDLTLRVAERAAPAYLMAVAGNADPMLGYLTTSFREHPATRRRLGKRLTTSMEQRLATLGALDADGAPRPGIASVSHLYGAFHKAGGDTRSVASIEEEGRRRLERAARARLRSRRTRGRRRQRAGRGDLRACPRGALCDARPVRDSGRRRRSRARALHRLEPGRVPGPAVCGRAAFRRPRTAREPRVQRRVARNTVRDLRRLECACRQRATAGPAAAAAPPFARQGHSARPSRRRGAERARSDRLRDWRARRSRARCSSDRREAGHRSQYALRIPDVRPGRRRPPALEVADSTIR